MLKKVISVFLLAALCAGLIYGNFYTHTKGSASDGTVSGGMLNIMYTDDSMTDYLSDAAATYENEYGIKVNLCLKGGLEYLEQIQELSVKGTECPDVYLLSSESLEKAYLSGLCVPVKDKESVLNTSYYPMSAVNAVTYKGEKLGYPVEFETALLMYNETYLEQIAEKTIQDERNLKAAEEAGEEIDARNVEEESTGDSAGDIENQPVSKEEILKRRDEIIPTSVVGILDFANSYDAPEGVESFLKWNVNDIMFNYFFAGSYMNVGGEFGDTKEEVDIYNSDAMYGLSIFRDFNQFFSMDSKEISYDSVLDDFIAGRTVFTVTDAKGAGIVAKAIEDGSFKGEFGVTTIGMLNSNLRSKMLSVTDCAVVNAYGSNIEEAEKFAKFVSLDYSENMYARTGKMSAVKHENYAFPAMEQIYETYENSESLPKIIESSNYWVLAELCFSKVWNGADVNDSLRELSEKVKSEISGAEVTEDVIETPEVTESYTEESD